jgi:hypothetical protein
MLTCFPTKLHCIQLINHELHNSTIFHDFVWTIKNRAITRSWPSCWNYITMYFSFGHTFKECSHERVNVNWWVLLHIVGGFFYWPKIGLIQTDLLWLLINDFLTRYLPCCYLLLTIATHPFNSKVPKLLLLLRSYG